MRERVVRAVRGTLLVASLLAVTAAGALAWEAFQNGAEFLITAEFREQALVMLEIVGFVSGACAAVLFFSRPTKSDEQ